MTLLQILSIGVPFVIMAACDWLKQDTLPDRVNAAIIIVTTIILAALWALVDNQLVGNFYADILVVAAISFSIMNIPELAGVRAWLSRILVSPFAMFAPVTPMVTPVTLRSSLPRRDASLSQRAVTVDEISSQPTRPMPPQGGDASIPVQNTTTPT